MACAHGQAGRLRADTEQMAGQIEQRGIFIDPAFNFLCGEKNHQGSFFGKGEGRREKGKIDGIAVVLVLSFPSLTSPFPGKPVKHGKQQQRQRRQDEGMVAGAGEIAVENGIVNGQ